MHHAVHVEGSEPNAGQCALSKACSAAKKMFLYNEPLEISSSLISAVLLGQKFVAVMEHVSVNESAAAFAVCIS